MAITRARNATLTLEKGLERKVAAYIVTSVFLAIAFSAPVYGDVIYYSGPQSIAITPGDTFTGTSYYNLDITAGTGGPITDPGGGFRIFNQFNSPFPNDPSAELGIGGNSPNDQVLINPGLDAAALSTGALISSTSLFGAGEGSSGAEMGQVFPNFPAASVGSWAGAQDMYLGLSFQDASGNTYYGWAELSFPYSGTATLEGWAYESTPGEGILAGAVSVPEPSSFVLMLMALGTMGAAALHQSRKKAQIQAQVHSAA